MGQQVISYSKDTYHLCFKDNKFLKFCRIAENGLECTLLEVYFLSALDELALSFSMISDIGGV